MAMGMPGPGAMPQTGEPMGQDQGNGGGMSADKIIGSVSDTLMALADAASKTQPQTAKALAKLNEQFLSIMSGATGGKMPEMQGAEDSGMQPMMDQTQGMPMGPQGMPMGRR